MPALPSPPSVPDIFSSLRLLSPRSPLPTNVVTPPSSQYSTPFLLARDSNPDPKWSTLIPTSYHYGVPLTSLLPGVIVGTLALFGFLYWLVQPPAAAVAAAAAAEKRRLKRQSGGGGSDSDSDGDSEQQEFELTIEPGDSFVVGRDGVRPMSGHAGSVRHVVVEHVESPSPGPSPVARAYVAHQNPYEVRRMSIHR